MASTRSAKRSTLASSSGASTSSRMQNGEGLMRKRASSSDSAVRAFFAAREKLHRLGLLTRGLGRDVDARLERVVLVNQIEAGGPTPEEGAEGLGKDLVDLLEGGHEPLDAGGVDLANRLVEGAQGLHQVVALSREETRALLELVQLLECEEVDRPEALERGAQRGDVGAEALRSSSGSGSDSRSFSRDEIELVGGVLAKPLPVAVGTGLPDLDGMEDSPAPSHGLAAETYLLFERTHTSAHRIDFFGQTPLMLSSGGEQALFLSEAGARADDLVLGALPFARQTLGFGDEGADALGEGAALRLEPHAFGVGSLGAFDREPLLGAPAVELAQGLRSFFAIAGTLDGGIFNRLLELVAAFFQLADLSLEPGDALADFCGLGAAALLIGGQRLQLSFDPSQVLGHGLVDRRGSRALLLGGDQIGVEDCELLGLAFQPLTDLAMTV